MCTVRFISDLHFGHKGMAQGPRKFQDEFYHDEFIIDSWNSVVRSKKDLTIIPGDITLETAKHYHLLDRLNGRKIVGLGNHDRPQDVRRLLEHVESVFGVLEYKGYIVSHVPLHPKEITKYRANIHGHIHNGLVLKNNIEDSMYVNVCAEVIGYRPVTLEEILLIRQRKRLNEETI